MAANDGDEVSIGVTAFNAHCLALIDDVARGKGEPRVPDQAQSADGGGCCGGRLSGAVLGSDARDGRGLAQYRSDPRNRRRLRSRSLIMARPALLDTCTTVWLMNSCAMLEPGISN